MHSDFQYHLSLCVNSGGGGGACDYGEKKRYRWGAFPMENAVEIDFESHLSLKGPHVKCVFPSKQCYY